MKSDCCILFPRCKKKKNDNIFDYSTFSWTFCNFIFKDLNQIFEILMNFAKIDVDCVGSFYNNGIEKHFFFFYYSKTKLIKFRYVYYPVKSGLERKIEFSSLLY